MGERRRIPIPFGEGLDRASGLMVADGTAHTDLRNVVLYEGKMQARRGILSKATLAGMSDLIAIAPFRSQLRTMMIAWVSSTRQLSLWRAASTGLVPENIFNWFISEAVTLRPRALMAEVAGKMVIAHDYHEVKPAATYYRGETKIYDPAGAGSFVNLTADLDRTAGAETVRFRGVAAYLSYLIGWGYGTGTDENRSEYLRISLHGQPTVFDPDHYFLVGVRGDPIVGGVALKSGFLVFKESETHVLLGEHPANFGVFPLDPHFGLAAARLAVALGDGCYAWGLEGPRLFTPGGQSEDLALPLDIGGPSPTTLVAEGDSAFGYAAYLPLDRCILFLFPSDTLGTTRGYCLSLKGRPKWSYWEIGQRVISAGVLFTSAAGAPPPGYPAFAATTSNTTGTTATLNWTNTTTVVGDETVEVWLKAGAGAWTLAYSVAVTALGAQSQAATGLTPSTVYLQRQRFRRGSYFNVGAESGDAGAWTSTGVQGTFTTPALPAPPAANFLWDSCTSDASYVRHKVKWTADPVRGARIYESTTNNSATAVEISDYGVHPPGVGSSDYTMVRDITPGAPQLYFWHKYTESGVAVGAFAALNLNATGGINFASCNI